MGLVGADVDQLRTLARTLGQAADRLENMTATVTSMLGATTWLGPDADRHRSQWHAESVAQVRAVAAALRDAGHIAARNADEQEQASNATGGGGTPGPWTGLAPPQGIGEVPHRLDGINPAVNIRDFLNSNAVWPVTWGTLLGPLDDWGALPLLDALGLASDSGLTDEQKIFEAQNSMTDLAGGVLKSRGGAVGYLSGVAVAQWGDVINQAARADFSASTLQTTADYLATNPAGAFEAARDAVIGYVPKLFSNVVPW